MTTVKKGNFVIIDVDSVDPSTGVKGQKPESGGGYSELETPPTDVDTPEFDPDAKTGPGYARTMGKVGRNTKEYKSTEALGKGGNKQKVTDFWNKSLTSAMSSSSGKLSEKARRLLQEITTSKPKVNWKRELRKFLDQAFNQFDVSLPNRRMLSTGNILYGKKKVGSDTLKTLVLAVDTSGSISKSQIRVFFEEVWNLSTKFDVDETIIIYCSDDIDNVDVVKKGKKPDLDKYASTGGNAKGFSPPFAYLQQNKITPSAFIYLTDSFAAYPSSSNYGIDKYKNKVFWFICNATSQFEKPPFGKYIHVPMDQQGNFL
jgi:predicted metal-dependent peptidase